MIARAAIVIVAALPAVADVSAATAVRIVSRDPNVCADGLLQVEPSCDSETCAGEKRTVSWTARDGVADVAIALGPAASQWRIHAVATGCWSAAVSAKADAEAVSIPLFPAAQIAATFVPPRGDRAPDAVKLRVSSPRLNEFPEAAGECTRAKEQWLCQVPATEVDVRLAPPGFVPHYIWGLRPARGRTDDLGLIHLRRGASIVGRVSAASRDDAGPITVALTPEAELNPQAAGLRTLYTKTNARGFFQFTGIDPGLWAVTATKSGWSPATTTIAATEREEAVLSAPLVLEPLAELEIVLTPPRDVDGLDWNVSLERSSGSGNRLRVAARPAADGMWKAENLERGMYIVTVTSSAGTVVHQRGDMVSHGMAPLQIAVETVTVRGTVTAGDDPVEARLEFRHDYGKRASMRSAADGTFSGALPADAEPRWNIKVTPTGSAASMFLNGVHVAPIDGVARIDIALPDGRLAGVVVDEAGQPQRARVRIRRHGRVIADAPTASDGTFSVHGIAAGAVEIQAWTHNGGDSGFVAHEIKASDDEPLTIVARQRLKVQAQVLAPGGRPYAGAIVRVLRSGRMIVDEATSPAGRFPVHAPAQDTIAHAIVIAPGYGATMRIVPLTGDEDSRRITLTPLFGQVWVPAGERPSDWPLIAPLGMPPVNLYSWLEPFPSPASRPVRGGRIVNLESGTYRFCADLRMQVCVDHTVTAGAQHSIEFPR